MTGVTIIHEAEVELWEAVAYYEARARGLGLDFEIAIERSVQAIAEHPERWLSVQTAHADISLTVFPTSLSTPTRTITFGFSQLHTANVAH